MMEFLDFVSQHQRQWRVLVPLHHRTLQEQVPLYPFVKINNEEKEQTSKPAFWPQNVHSSSR